MASAQMFIGENAQDSDVLALIGRACSVLVEEYGWDSERLRRRVAAELEDVIAEEPRLRATS